MTTDRWNVRLVIVFLGGFGLLIAAGAMYLANGSHSVPGELWTLAGTAVGALSSLLSKTGSEQMADLPAQPVQVVNPSAAPVPVAPTPAPAPPVAPTPPAPAGV